MNIHVQETLCWVCGTGNKKMTMHHTIPQHLKPVKNVVVPVCRACHDKINENDVSGMYQFAIKIMKKTEQLHKEAEALKSVLENHCMDRLNIK